VLTAVSGSDTRTQSDVSDLPAGAVLIFLSAQIRIEMALFYFLRHGATAWNVEGGVCGSADVPLSDMGRRQAQLLAERLKSISVVALYSSPLQRALETALLICEAMGREPVVDSRLTELNYGTWEGMTFEEIERATPALYRAWNENPADLAPPGGETGVQLIQRVTAFLAEVAQKDQHGTVMVVCHKTVCRLLACHVMGVPLAEYRRRVPMANAALNVFETQGGTWRVLELNDTSHLRGPSEIGRSDDW
jgi:probable phosphoglycerate mutase